MSGGEFCHRIGNPTISRADVAAFMYQAAHTGEWIHRSPVITD
jgi:hypothetical protein